MAIDQSNLAATRDAVIARGQIVYEEKLRAALEREHFGRYVALEPESGRYFLGDTSAEASGAAHDALPERRFYLLRVGYETAHSIGGHAIHQR